MFHHFFIDLEPILLVNSSTNSFTTLIIYSPKEWFWSYRNMNFLVCRTDWWNICMCINWTWKSSSIMAKIGGKNCIDHENDFLNNVFVFLISVTPSLFFYYLFLFFKKTLFDFIWLDLVHLRNVLPPPGTEYHISVGASI